MLALYHVTLCFTKIRLPATSPKLLDLLLAVVPGVARVAVLANPSVPSHASVMRNLQDAARRAKVELLPVDVDTVAEIESGFAHMARERIKAVVVLGDPMVFFHRRQIADLALKHGIASAYPARQHSEDGGLMSYGVNIAVCHVPPDLAHPRSETILATFRPET